MSFRSPSEARFVQRLFRRYYEKEYTNPFIPSDFEKREFGYMPFGQKIMVRHISFKTFEELKKTLVNEAPLHVYRSAAVYMFPQAPMEEKGWVGSELIFDIDADHLETKCKRIHDYFQCLSCGSLAPDKASKCTTCDGEIIDVKMVCDLCLNKAKDEMRKLIDFLTSDFGMDPSTMTLSFSGNRGYHLAVKGEEVMELDRAARQEIVEYITGTHIDMRFYGLPGAGPGFEDHGWGGRIARGSLAILTKLAAGDDETVEKISTYLNPREVSKMAELARYWKDRPRWDLLKTGKRSSKLEALIKMAVEYSASHVDTVVTTDVHRLLRLSDTLNGKTALKACTIKINDLDTFDPLRDSVALDRMEQVEIRVFKMPAFKLGGETFGPFGNEVVKLPIYAAAYILCKGLGLIMERGWRQPSH